MKSHDFCVSRWVKLLAQSLASLEQTERKYRSELGVIPMDDDSHYVQTPSFSHSFSELNAVKALLRKHPALNRALGPSEDNEEFRIAIANSAMRISLIDIVARLMNYATKSSFDDAASRLQELLSSQKERKFPCYHVSVFLGVRLDEEIQLSDGISIAPFETVRKFIDSSDLNNVVRNSKQLAQAGSLGVVLKPSEWEPIIPAAGEKLESDINWDDKFPEDAQTIVDLLSIAHGVPVINIICFEFCVDRQVSELLGTPIGGGAFIRHAGFFIDDHVNSVFSSKEKLSQVKDIFSRLKNHDNELERYEPVISRLSSSLLRKGRFGPEDKILDVAIALEQMYEIDGSGIAYKLGTRASWFLEGNGQKRVEVFDKVKDFYRARSDVVHYRKREKGKAWKTEQSDSGFNLACKTLLKLLQNGSPPNWDRLVLSGGSQ